MKSGKTALSKRENHSDKISELREEALSLLACSVKFGIERELYLAAALYNIKTFDVFSADGITFTAFIKERKISDTSAKRYVRIGKGLASLISEEPHFLTKSDLEKYSASALTLDTKLTLNGLDTATRDLTLFKKYLAGEIDTLTIKSIGKSVGKLLGDSSVEIETMSSTEQIATILQSTPVTNELLALELWKRLESKVSLLSEQCKIEVSLHSDYFIDWYPTANPILKEGVNNRVRTIILQLSKLQEIFTALYRCDNGDLNSAMEEIP